jgi:hypothetical protein
MRFSVRTEFEPELNPSERVRDGSVQVQFRFTYPVPVQFAVRGWRPLNRTELNFGNPNLARLNTCSSVDAEIA